ncbi:MAG: TolC family protein, partial [Desulfobacterales bacterium]|nr:TolC family protein [Desulfobacterales bacterium]
SGLYRYDDPPTIVQTNQGLAKLNNALSTITHGQVPEVSLPSGSRTYYGAGLQVTQPLYTGNKLTATRRLARANLENARKNLDASDNDLALSARKAFYTVILSRQMAGAMDEAVESMTEHVKEATAYHDQKIVPKLDLLRAEEKLADLRQQQLYARNNAALAQTSLNYVLGVDMDTRYAYDDAPQTLAMPRGLGACIKTGLEERPEIGAVDAQVQMAKQQISIAQSDYLPTLALVGEAHRYEPENEDPSAQIGIVASIDLFDSGRTSHKKAQAARQLEKALTAKKQLFRGIRLEVEKAYHDAQAALKSINVAEKSLDTAREALDAARTRYRVGLSTSLERLDAEVSLTRAKTNHIHALSMYNIAVAELERAMGKE